MQYGSCSVKWGSPSHHTCRYIAIPFMWGSFYTHKLGMELKCENSFGVEFMSVRIIVHHCAKGMGRLNNRHHQLKRAFQLLYIVIMVWYEHIS